MGRVQVAEDRQKSRVHKGGFGRTGEGKGELARWPRSDRLRGGFRACQGVGKNRKADKQVLANTLGGFTKTKATLIKNKSWCFRCNEVIISAYFWGLACLKHQRQNKLRKWSQNWKKYKLVRNKEHCSAVLASKQSSPFSCVFVSQSSKIEGRNGVRCEATLRLPAARCGQCTDKA